MYIHVKGIILIPKKKAAADANLDNRNKKVIFKDCAPFLNCISEVNNTEIVETHDVDLVRPMYNLIEWGDIYSKISESLWQYYRDEPALRATGNIVEFPADNNNSILFKFKQNITGQIGNDCINLLK